MMTTYPRVLARRLIHTCDIESFTAGTPSAINEPQKSYTPAGTGVACRFIEEGVRDQDGTVGQISRYVRRIWFLPDQAADLRYRITNIQDEDGNVVSAGPWYVTDIRTPTSRKRRSLTIVMVDRNNVA